MTDSKAPEGMETKDTGGGGGDPHTRVSGVNTEEQLLKYTPAAVPNKDGMADGFTPGTTNTPGPYEAPKQESGGPKSASGTRASKTASKS